MLTTHPSTRVTRGPVVSVPVPALWGVLNVTPDSFSDGGLFLDPDAAIARGVQMAHDGASVIDVGAESTRPGASRIDAETEIARLEPVVRGLVEEGITVSVDTMRYSLAHYGDVVTDVVAELGTQRDAAVEAGIEPERIMLDPGLGFAKNTEHNWELLRGIDVIAQMGHGVLVGGSRKRFLGALLPGGHSATDRDGVSVALGVALAGRGVSALRVHEPSPHRVALELWKRVQPGGE